MGLVVVEDGHVVVVVEDALFLVEADLLAC